MRKPAVIACCALAVSVLSCCSPYPFSQNVETFSGAMGSIDASYKESNQKILAERRLAERILWIRDKPKVLLSPGCSIDASGPEPCRLIAADGRTTLASDAKPKAIKPAADVCENVTDPAVGPSVEKARMLAPLQRADLLRALDDYAAGLAAVTKAQDRADFDNAASKVSAAVGELAQSAAGATGAGTAAAPVAGEVAKASTSAALWLVGQSLDHQRLEQLRISTQAACHPIHVLAAALTVVLEEQRGNRLDVLFQLLTLKLQAMEIARTTPHITDQAYGAAIDDAQAAADAFQTVRASNPKGVAQALSDAHDALLVAVRENSGQFKALITSLQNFAQQADELAASAAAQAPVAGAPAKTPAKKP